MARRTDVLKVPNAALRFKPEAAAAPKGGRARRGPAGRARARAGPQRLDPGEPGGPPQPVRVDARDQRRIVHGNEGARGRCATGQEVITGLPAPRRTRRTMVNPFAPRLPGRGGRALTE